MRYNIKKKKLNKIFWFILFCFWIFSINSIVVVVNKNKNKINKIILILVYNIKKRVFFFNFQKKNLCHFFFLSFIVLFCVYILLRSHFKHTILLLLSACFIWRKRSSSSSIGRIISNSCVTIILIDFRRAELILVYISRCCCCWQW